MCLITLSWQPDTEYPLILVANRDEFYERPAKTVHFWEDNPEIFGGRDLEAGGSWLALSCRGRIAAITNYREWPLQPGALSRGHLVSNFLNSNLSPKEYLNKIHHKADHYSGFNLLVGDSSGLYYYSNRMGSVVSLKPGFHALSNHLLNSPWPKLEKVKQGLAQHVEHHRKPEPEALISMMHDDSKAPDDQLPNTGVSQEQEKFLSSCFIASEQYGTRNTSVLILDRQGSLSWTEQIYLPHGQTGKKRQLSMAFPVSWQPAARSVNLKNDHKAAKNS
ncbi:MULTISPECIES: NRDE family protein [unclassified Endozoicomonas]|uniref:NRDE family protein n=1 Tax=unclassified Endozoicomonas TaxID=2644528 RepID=UPI002147DAB0|nr:MULTISPECIES: NRDE family protein [unclassified Endozoicomonas]